MDSSDLESIGLKLANVADPVASFAQAAADYCSLIELCEQFTTHQFIHHARYQIPKIYLTVLTLPKVEPTEDCLNRDITHEEWSTVLEQLRNPCLHLHEYRDQSHRFIILAEQ